jgi:hypothetical protein
MSEPLSARLRQDIRPPEAAQTGSSEDRSPRRAIRPDEDLADLQTDISSETPSRDGGCVEPEPEPEILVEPDGIEPTTSCLQSTRSPN